MSKMDNYPVVIELFARQIFPDLYLKCRIWAKLSTVVQNVAGQENLGRLVTIPEISQNLFLFGKCSRFVLL